MALSSNTQWEVRTTGADTNGGGFKATGTGTDYSQQDAAQFSGTDLVIDAVTNTKVTSVGHSFVSSDVGNLIQISAGTGFTTGFFEVVSVSGGAATLDRSAGTLGSTGGTWALGGAVATPGKIGGVLVAGNVAYVKAGTYTITNTTANTASGPVNPAAGTAWVGYNTNRNPFNTDTKPVIQLSGVTNTYCFGGGGTSVVINFELDGGSVTTGRGTDSIYQVAIRCYGHHFTGGAFKGPAFACSATACSATGAFQHSAVHCVAYSNTFTGFVLGSGALAVNCLSVNNSGASTNGFSSSTNALIIGCTAYGNGQHGFYYSGGASGSWMQNCLAVGNTGSGLNLNQQARFAENCATQGNGSSTTVASGWLNAVNNITALSGDPFANAAGGDFSLDNTASEGAACRSAATPVAMPGVAATNTYQDLGAVHHADPAAGAMILARVFGGF